MVSIRCDLFTVEGAVQDKKRKRNSRNDTEKKKVDGEKFAKETFIELFSI